ncbi:MAG TPA: hypothetical protein VFA83_22500 [Acidimicrobiales bacterium]|nr:hypothetical protein [Acidimicrobiales bacterium]
MRAGEDVTIVLAASDVAHDFTIDELALHFTASPGQPGAAAFTHRPPPAGTTRTAPSPDTAKQA